MIRTPSISCALAAALAFSAVAPAARAAGPTDVEKPMKTLISSVRYSKDDMALKMLDGDAQGRMLLEADWDKGTPEQRAEFTKLFHELFASIAFPKIRENLSNLATTLYEAATITGDNATVKSTLVIDHPLQKKELKVEYALHKVAKDWRVVDVTVLGTGGFSMLGDIRKEQVRPLFAKNGWDGLLKLMRDRRDALAKQAAAQKK